MTSSSDILAANPTRELAAIMFSDIVGYTAIMGRDEQLAMRALAAHRELLRSILPRFNGRQVGEIGDGTLSSFHSAFDAVSCAREIQASLAGDSELRIRIGIHVGDVVFTNNTVLGDGVNVASRIHELAPPGGVCISERVFDDIRNKPGIQAQDLGQKTLKNVNRPIRAYLLTNASPESVTCVWRIADSGEISNSPHTGSGNRLRARRSGMEQSRTRAASCAYPLAATILIQLIRSRQVQCSAEAAGERHCGRAVVGDYAVRQFAENGLVVQIKAIGEAA